MSKFAIKDDAPLAVCRPADPEKAVRLAKERVGSENPHALSHIVALCGPYTFVGFLSTDGALLDKEGNVIGKPEPGDSLFHPEALQALS